MIYALVCSRGSGTDHVPLEFFPRDDRVSVGITGELPPGLRQPSYLRCCLDPTRQIPQLLTREEERRAGDQSHRLEQGMLSRRSMSTRPGSANAFVAAE